MLLTHVDSPTHSTARDGEVATLDAVATFADEEQTLMAILVNRSTDRPMSTSLDLRGFPALEVVERLQVCDDDAAATNSPTHPDRIRAHPGPSVDVADSSLTLELPPTSWTMVRLAGARADG